MPEPSLKTRHLRKQTFQSSMETPILMQGLSSLGRGRSRACEGLLHWWTAEALL